jgi:hypothetical protein
MAGSIRIKRKGRKRTFKIKDTLSIHAGHRYSQDITLGLRQKMAALKAKPENYCL